MNMFCPQMDIKNGHQQRPHTSGQNHLQTFGDTVPQQSQHDFQRLMSADTTKRFHN